MTWRSLVSQPIHGAADATAFVFRVGFCTWGSVRGLDFSNLADALGETAWSVPDRTWFWKDDLHFDRRVYYAKIIRGQPSFIARSFLPAFVAALGGAGRRAEPDPRQLYIDGRLSREA